MKKGLTLIEILVTMSIVAVIAGALVISLSKYVPGINLNGTSSQIINDLRLSQERAITEQRQNGMKFYPLEVPVRYEMIRISESGREVLKTDNLASGIGITLADAMTDNEIFFSSDGGPTSSGDIIISLESSNKSINVSPAGYIKLND